MWHVWLVLSASPLSESTSQCLSPHQSLIPDLQSSSLWLPPYSSPATPEEAHYWQSTSSAEPPSDSSLHQTDRQRERQSKWAEDAANERISYIYTVFVLFAQKGSAFNWLCVVWHIKQLRFLNQWSSIVNRDPKLGLQTAQKDKC